MSTFAACWGCEHGWHTAVVTTLKELDNDLITESSFQLGFGKGGFAFASSGGCVWRSFSLQQAI